VPSPEVEVTCDRGGSLGCRWRGAGPPFTSPGPPQNPRQQHEYLPDTAHCALACIPASSQAACPRPGPPRDRAAGRRAEMATGRALQRKRRRGARPSSGARAGMQPRRVDSEEAKVRGPWGGGTEAAEFAGAFEMYTARAGRRRAGYSGMVRRNSIVRAGRSRGRGQADGAVGRTARATGNCGGGPLK